MSHTVVDVKVIVSVCGESDSIGCVFEKNHEPITKEDFEKKFGYLALSVYGKLQLDGIIDKMNSE